MAVSSVICLFVEKLAMPLVNAAKHVALDALDGTNPVTSISHISLHDGDPSAGGANEIAGGAPAYARQSATWNAAATGQKTISNTPVFDVPGGTTITHIGLWDASTGGTFLGYAAITNEAFGGQGTYTITSLTLALNDV